MQYEERFSTLAVASLVLGILSLICFIFHRMHPAVVIVDILLGIGAIVTGVFGMRHAASYSLKGRNYAFVGIVTGANGVGWVIIETVFRMVYS